jgi:hypothetical protein
VDAIAAQVSGFTQMVGSLARPGLEAAVLPVRLLSRLAEQVLAAVGTDEIGSCPVCGAPVSPHAPHVRYGGRVYHAEPCAETSPPAETHRLLADAAVG